MQKYIKTVIDEENLPINPFVSFLSIAVNEVKQGLKHNGEDNKVLFEEKGYCKLFTDPKIRQHLSRLTGNAWQMLGWIMSEVKPSKDYLWVNKVRYMEEHKIKSIKTVNKALYELDNQRVIDAIAGMKDVYFINPAIFFNGSRINKYPDNIEQ